MTTTTATLTDDDVDALFHALADRTRRDILRRSLAGEYSVSTLASHYDMSFAAVQKHVAVLEHAGLVTKRRVGREALASGEVTAVRSVSALLSDLEQIWRGRVARIDALLAADHNTEDHNTEASTTTTPATTTPATTTPATKE